VIHSLMLLCKVDNYSGLGDWVYQTDAAMTAEEKENHALVVEGLYYVINPEQSWPSFPAYLDHLASVPPETLVKKMLDAYLQKQPCVDAPLAGDANLMTTHEEILQDVNSYLRFLRQRFAAEHIKVEVERRAYTYAIDPPALQQVVVDYLRHMWRKYLAVEWETVRPMLQQSVAAFQQVDFSQIDRQQALQLVTGRAEVEEKWVQWMEEAERVVCIPSAHAGPYLGSLFGGGTLTIVFGARIPEGAAVDAPELSRAEILVRLSALADDTRLTILKLVAEEGELRSQDIINMLNLSQSAASRHLQQLSATGFLTERRCQGAKCYQINPQRIENTLLAVGAYLAIASSPDARPAGNYWIEDYAMVGLGSQAAAIATPGNMRLRRGRLGGHHELV
jgi:DNA-binding transcriptional ArsR family regulator